MRLGLFENLVVVLPSVTKHLLVQGKTAKRIGTPAHLHVDLHLGVRIAAAAATAAATRYQVQPIGPVTQSGKLLDALQFGVENAQSMLLRAIVRIGVLHRIVELRPPREARTAGQRSV